MKMPKIYTRGTRVRYILLSDLPEPERSGFRYWMRDQTMPEIAEGEAAYPGDYERWLDYKARRPVVFD